LPKVSVQAGDAAPRYRAAQAPMPPRPQSLRAAPAVETLKSEESAVSEQPAGHEVPRSAKDLQAELRDVSNLFTRTADELAAAVAEVREGKLPSADGKSIGSLAPAFARLVGHVRTSAEALGVGSAQAFYSVNDLEPAIAAIDSAEKAQAEAARTAQLLEQVLSLATLDGRDFAPLTSLKESARALQQEVAGRPGTLDSAVREKLHGYELVLHMVDAHAAPDEDAEEVVATQFGAKLLFALGTGRIVRSMNAEPDVQVAVVASLPESKSGVEIPLESTLADESKAAFQA
jgi:hypothetical protein